MKQLINKFTGLLLIALLMIGLVPAASFADTGTNAKIFITGDDAYKLYVNGVFIGGDWQNPGPDEMNWSDIETYNVNLLEDYIITVEAADLFGSIAGLSIKVVMNEAPMTTFDITNGVWKVSTAVNANWMTEKIYSTDDNWQTVVPVTPHANWPLAGNWGWTKNSLNPIDKIAFFKYYVPKSVVNVYHYIVGTTTPVGTAPQLSGMPGTAYITAPIDPIDYTLTTTPVNANGTYNSTPTDVIYYYTANPVVTGVVNVYHYIVGTTTPVGTSPQLSGVADTAYVTAPIAPIGYTLTTTPVNANGSFNSTSIDVIYYYTAIPETTQPEPTQPEPTQPETTQPETTQPETVVIVEEPVALGENTVVNFDAYLPLETSPVASVEDVIILDEATPQADALPQTGQLPARLFMGLGGLISAVGVFLKRK